MAGESQPQEDPETQPRPEENARQETSLGRGDFVLATAVAAVALAMYVATLAPGLLQADSGEFQTLAVTLGYAHPTGYPVYLLLAKAATVLPVADVPYRVNLLSAVMGAAAAAGMYLLGRLLTAMRWVPLAGAMAWAVSPTFWSQAILAEVYTSGVVCMVAVLACLECWRQTGRVRWLFAGACVGGVSLGIHATHALMAPAALLVVLLTPRRWKANWAAAVLGAATGAAVTLGAFAVIDRADSPTSYFRTVISPSRSLWNLEPEDMDSFPERVALSMSPPQYKRLLFSRPWAVTREKAIGYLGNLPNELPPLWLIAAAIGVVWLGRRNWKMTLLLALTLASHLFYDLFYDMGDIHVLYIATYVPIALFAVAGFAAVSVALHRLAARFGRWKLTEGYGDFLVAGLALGAAIWPMVHTDAWTIEGRREIWLPPDERDAPFRVEYSAEFHQQVRELIDDLEPDAVVFTDWCMGYPYYYVAHVEQGRTELTFLQEYPQIHCSELADSALEYVKEVSPHRPVYFTHRVKKVAEVFEMEPVRRGRETLYRVVGPIDSDGAPAARNE